MKRPILQWHLLLSFFCLASPVFSAQGRREHFLTPGPGAAAMALGESLVGHGMDASAGFYNPATLVNQYSGTMLEYSQPNLNATRSYLAFALGSPKTKIGGIWKNETLPLSSSKNGFLLSVGLSDRIIPYVPKGFSLGTTLGYVSETIAGFNATSFLASVGSAYTGLAGKFRYGLGATIKNFYFSGLQFRSEGEKEIWPIQTEMGASLSRWGVTLLGVLSSDGRNGFGVSYQPFGPLTLRAGMNGHPRLGIGLEVKKFRLDYALSLGELSQANFFTFSYLWGKPEKVIDYTNPTEELKAKHEPLAESILSGIRAQIQSGEAPNIHEVLKLLVVDLKNEDGWNFYESLTGKKRMYPKLPFFKKVRRSYLEFAIAYANDGLNAKELGRRFIEKYPNESVSRFVRIILERE